MPIILLQCLCGALSVPSYGPWNLIWNLWHLQVFAGLLVGAMLPYWFSAMTMKSVGKAALAMVEEVRRQFSEISGLMEGTARPDYRRCVEISTSVSLPSALIHNPVIIFHLLLAVSSSIAILHPQRLEKDWRGKSLYPSQNPLKFLSFDHWLTTSTLKAYAGPMLPVIALGSALN